MGYVHTGVTRVIHGDVTPNDETIAALAEALHVELATIYRLVGNDKASGRYWQPPAEVHRLNRREQDAVAEIIRVLAASKEAGEAGEGNAERAPSITKAGDGLPAHPTQYGLAAHRGIKGEEIGETHMGD